MANYPSVAEIGMSAQEIAENGLSDSAKKIIAEAEKKRAETNAGIKALVPESSAELVSASSN